MSAPKKGGAGYDKSGFDGSFQGEKSAKPAGANGLPTEKNSDGYVDPSGGDKGARNASKLGSSTSKDGYEDGGIRGDMAVEGHSKKKGL